jgi:hypothetical protein
MNKKNTEVAKKDVTLINLDVTFRVHNVTRCNNFSWLGLSPTRGQRSTLQNYSKIRAMAPLAKAKAAKVAGKDIRMFFGGSSSGSQKQSQPTRVSWLLEFFFSAEMYRKAHNSV